MNPQSEAASGRIDVISDAICPWCYIGKRQLEGALRLLADEGLAFDVRWHAYQLNPDMPVEGVARVEYRMKKFGDPERIRQMDARVAEAGAAVGLDIRHALMARTPNTLAAHRTIRLAGQMGVQDRVVEALFRGYFTEGQDIGDPSTLAELAAAAGLDSDRVRAMLAGEEGLADVRAEDAKARRAGIDGVPSFTMQGHVLFSGALPAATMAQAFARAWRILSQQAAE